MIDFQRGKLNEARTGIPLDNQDPLRREAWNRLVEVRDGGTQAIVAQYRYDGLGRRIRKLTPSGGNWTVREFYYNAGWQLVEVRQAADISRAGTPPAEPAVAAAVHEQYVWSARYIDAPIPRDRDAGEGGVFFALDWAEAGIEHAVIEAAWPLEPAVKYTLRNTIPPYAKPETHVEMADTKADRASPVRISVQVDDWLLEE